MRIVINIPEETVDRIKDNAMFVGSIPSEIRWDITNAIVNGTPLPKGHGRLIDADRLRSMYSINRANFNTVVGIQKWIDDAHTIIEADKEYEE